LFGLNFCLSTTNNTLQWSLKINRDRAEDIIELPMNLTSSSKFNHFLSARTDYFRAITQDSKQLISQAADFVKIRKIGFTYVRAYQDLLQELQNKI
jgi:hypothetical protein